MLDQMLSKHTIYFLVWVFFDALWSWRIDLLVCILHQCCQFFFVSVSFWFFVLAIVKNSCIGDCKHSAVFYPVVNVICPCHDSQAACRPSSENNSLSLWEKSILSFQFIKNFNFNVMTSEVNALTLNNNWIFSSPLMSWSIAIV